MTIPIKKPPRHALGTATTVTCSLLCGAVAVMTPDWRHKLLAAYENPISEGQSLNQTQKSMADVVFEACSQRNDQLEEDFRNRCDALVGASVENPGSAEVGEALFEASPEQITSFGQESTRTMAGHVNIVNASVLGRLETLRAGLGTTRFAGVQLFQNGQPITGGNAGSDAFGPLGVWINGNYHLGEVDSMPSQRGFNFKNWGVTGGADYRITDSLVAGGAFSYVTSDNEFDSNGGHADNDSYLGSVYGSYYPLENLYVDALATYGHINFDTTRNITYTIPGDTVNARAKGETDGSQWGFAVSTGYNLHWQGFNLTPYGRFSYKRLRVDDYRETGGDGWAIRLDEHKVRSMKSIVGAQASYAISLPWGVITPQFRGEWHHEFRDPSRTISASFVGDPLGQTFAIRVAPPDRDYATFGGDLTATFAHGISAFVGYEALVGYRHISSHRISFGTRIQF
ncbi:MAG: hypothetical protein Kow0060_18220 [Methylohalobius crimeensis]